ncbi:MAG TPA: DNA primase [Candidatus Scatomorpha gallistercoris]|nr:DNA primase [Candidatus Scatomorpha gallistercoris]
MAEIPEWYDGKHVNEVKFCEEFLKSHPMKSVNGTFFTVEGRVTDEDKLRREIYEMLKPYFSTGLGKRVNNLLEALRLEAYAPDLPIQRDRIHVANGTLFLGGTFSSEREFCRNRLPVAYNENAKLPETWLHFLDELLYPEDIPTLQEFMGYCFLPTTKGQKMLMLIGRGGEGKSRIGLVLRALLGANMATGSIAKIESSRFARADLEHELVMLDDDMKLEALPQTNHIKAIVTAELPMDLERKGQQSYQGDLYVRFLGFGNGSLKALYDRSEGFFRRQIILTTKPKDDKRLDDPFIAEKMCAEAEGIFLWCLDGLRRLISNDYRFTLSERARGNMAEAVSDGNNAVDFMRSEGYIRLKADAEASSRDVYAVYKLWCEDNVLHPLSARSLSAHLNENQREYNIEPTNNLYLPGGRRVRGYLGIEVLQRVS